MNTEYKDLLSVARGKFSAAVELIDDAILIVNEVNNKIGLKDIYVKEAELYFFSQVLRTLKELEGTAASVKEN
jgi:hypothetical protein